VNEGAIKVLGQTVDGYLPQPQVICKHCAMIALLQYPYLSITINFKPDTQKEKQIRAPLKL